MSAQIAERLYNLLPVVYRLRDADQGEPLRALMAVIEKQLLAIREDIDGLYENWFIETCEEWVVPYIGDLLGVRGLNPLSPTVFSQRPFVANTLHYRRGKGTVAVLEGMAHDITGWPARAVEFFELLETSQHLNHLRPGNVRTPDLRETNALELLGGPFEQAAYTVDVRHISGEQGKYNIGNVGIFLWRLQGYPVALATPWAVSTPPDGRFTFSPVGHDAPLFNLPVKEAQSPSRIEESDVPGELRRRALYDELEARRQAVANGDESLAVYFGPDPVLRVTLPSGTIPPEQIVVCDLSQWTRPPTTKTYTTSEGKPVSLDIAVAVDPKLGRLTFPAAKPPAAVQVSSAYGFSGNLGGGPYDRRQPRPMPGESAPAEPDTVADPNALNVLIRVPSAGIGTLGQALAAWDQHAHPRAVIQIEDSRTYAEALTVTFSGGGELTIQAANGERPTILGDILVKGGTGSERLVLNGLLVAGQLNVQDKLGALSIMHGTLVPGWSLQAGQPQPSDGPSLIVAATSDALSLNIDHSICGPLRLQAKMGRVTVEDSILGSPFRAGPAILTPALVSGNLAPFPSLSAVKPSVTVTMADEGPYTIVLPSKPTTLTGARDALQSAIQAASDSDAFAGARVIVVGNRLAVLPGVPSDVRISLAPGDPTAAELRLDPGSAREVTALVSGALSPFPALTSASPAVNVTMGADGPHIATMTPGPSTLAQARDQLQSSIRAAFTTDAFTGTSVGTLDDRLVVLPGASATPVIFRAAPSDSTTFRELALQSARPAIAADDAGDQPGPPASLLRTTILGTVHVRELTLASEVIFTAPVLADRRQVGCVRFSYVPAGSETPRRFRCQPDLALKDVTDPGERANTRVRLTPSFTSTTYGDPGYGQLSLLTADEIRTGAEDGSEMGAFSFLKQPQREANLQTSLAEYLRFGLEAGFFYVT